MARPSVGGSLTGEGGNFLILDDPINPMQAISPLHRKLVNQWFDHTFASRLNDKRKGVIVLVMQRLHQDDLTGYLLEKGGWQHLCLPMVAAAREVHDFGAVCKTREIGEFLHDGRENAETIERTKRELGSMAFSAQFQQQPVPEEGNMLRAWWFGRYKTVPMDITRRVQSWDTAIKSGARNDASVCLTFHEHDGRSYLIDVAVMRCEYPDLKKSVYNLYTRCKPHAVLVEDKASGQQLIQDLRREGEIAVIGLMPKNDKVTRFAAVSAMIEAGRLVLPEDAPWLAAFEDELLRFPNGMHDDQVDALTQYLDWLRLGVLEKLRVRVL
jgi:predicted phage terminase large subunit-like protein